MGESYYIDTVGVTEFGEGSSSPYYAFVSLDGWQPGQNIPYNQIYYSIVGDIAGQVTEDDFLTDLKGSAFFDAPNQTVLLLEKSTQLN